jgi:hypothetical protein
VASDGRFGRVTRRVGLCLQEVLYKHVPEENTLSGGEMVWTRSSDGEAAELEML